MNSSTSWRFSCRTPRATRPASMLRRTVSHGKRFGSWNTSPRSRLGPVISSSPTRSSPALGRSSPAISRSSVDFPQPLGPTSETISPAATESDDAVERERPSARSSGAGNTLLTSRTLQRRAFGRLPPAQLPPDHSFLPDEDAVAQLEEQRHDASRRTPP